MSRNRMLSGKKNKHVLPLISGFLVVILIMVMFFLGSSIVQSYWQQASEDATKITAQRAKILQTIMDKNINETQAFLNYSNRAFAVAGDRYNAYEEISKFSKGLGCKKAYYFMSDERIYSSDGRRLSGVDQNISRLLLFKGQAVSEPYYDSELGADVVAVCCAVDQESPENVSAAVAVYLEGEIYAQCFLDGQSGDLTYFINGAGKTVFGPADGEDVRTDTLTALFSYYGIDSSGADKILSDIAAGNDNAYEIEGASSKAIVGVSRVKMTNQWYAVTILTAEAVTRRAQGILSEIIVVGAIIFASFIMLLLIYGFSDFKSVRRIASAENFDRAADCSNQSKFEADCQTLLQKYPSAMYGIMYLNIENYKYVHQIFGFKVGDEMILTLSKIISKRMKYNDTYGRLSDGRMAIMCSYKNKTELTELFQAISDTIIGSFEPLRGMRYKVKLTAGIYLVDRSQKLQIAEMIDHAVFALQSTAPDSDVLYSFFSEKDRERALNIAGIEAAMEQALKNREFELYLQPKLNIQQMKIYGAEALVRWNRPGSGILSPDEFIPVFEKNGFISQIDKYIFDQVCRFLRETIDSGKRVIPISVNVSRSSADRSDFIEHYISTKNRYGIVDNFLELEFTESLAMESYESLGKTVQTLRQNGFWCSIDDFGAGYSSFKALKALPFNIIKLDKFFLMESQDSQRDEYLLASVISMAKMLDMRVIMEGVETEEEVNRLRKMKCDAIQGYYYARPMPVDEFAEFVEKAFERPARNRLHANLSGERQ